MNLVNRSEEDRRALRDFIKKENKKVSFFKKLKYKYLGYKYRLEDLFK